MSQDQIRLFIIDDHFLINDGFNQLFDPEVDGIKTVGSAVSVESAVKQIHALDVHIIILDLYLKLFDQIFNIKHLYHEFPAIPVIILTIEESITWKIRMLREGAKAYLTKDMNREAMRNVIKSVIAGHTVFPDDIIHAIRLNEEASVKYQLSYSEREIVNFISKGELVKEIAARKSRNISTINKILHKLRKEFQAKNNTDLVRILMQLKELF